MGTTRELWDEPNIHVSQTRLSVTFTLHIWRI